MVKEECYHMDDWKWKEVVCKRYNSQLSESKSSNMYKDANAMVKTRVCSECVECKMKRLLCQKCSESQIKKG